MHFEFHAYSFGTETIITFIRSRCSRENHARFQTKHGHFRSKRPKNPTGWGGTQLYGFHKGAPPPVICFVNAAITPIQKIIIGTYYDLLTYFSDRSARSDHQGKPSCSVSLPLTIIIELVIASKGNQRSKAYSQRIEDLRCCSNPDLEINVIQ